MILTVDDSSGRVLYPLPLSSIDEPDITTMRRTLQRLYQQYDNENEQSFSIHNQTMTEFSKIDHENEILKHEIQQMERVFAATYGDGFY